MYEGDNMTDMDIVTRCIDGEKECFSQIVSRYKNLVYSVALKMTTDNEEAKDIAQDVFVKIYVNLNKYSPEYKFSTWIMKITTNHIIDMRRKKKFDTVCIEDMEYKLSIDTTPEKTYLEKEQKQLIEQLIKNLDEIYKVPIMLYYDKGLSYNEIAEQINEPISKVKNRIFRARKILKKEMLKFKECDDLGLQNS